MGISLRHTYVHVIGSARYNPRNRWTLRADGLYELAGSAYAFRDDQVQVCTRPDGYGGCACDVAVPLAVIMSGRGKEIRVTPHEADVVVDAFASDPAYRVVRTWERVQSIVTVYEPGALVPLVSYLMPVTDFN